jgi:pilus assembly protein CpaC
MPMNAARMFAAMVTLTAALLFALVIPAGTAQGRENPGASAQGANVDFILPGKGALNIEVHKGMLVRLDKPANAIFVANPAIADVQVKSPRLVYVFGASVGETTLFAVGEDEQVLANFTVQVTHNLAGLRSAIAALEPGSDIKVYSADRNLVLDGEVESPLQAENIRQLAQRFAAEGALINRLSVAAANQVNLRVRVAEVSRSVVKQFGINWDAVLTGGGFLFGLATGNPLLAAGNFLTRENGANNVFASGTLGRNLDLNVLVDALADEGLLNVLAEPNLTALSGESASFLAGGEFPIPVPGANDSVTITFKKFGVRLAFTPVILDSGRISLEVAPEVSQLSATGAVNLDNFVIPALTTRQARTTVELASGQSFAIAGLLQNNLNHDLSKFPGLGDLPLLGSLFRSDRFQRDETELVILITPYLVRPVSNRQLAEPGKALTPANDIERILKGRNYGKGTGAVATGGEKVHLSGSAGFIVE